MVQIDPNAQGTAIVWGERVSQFIAWFMQSGRTTESKTDTDPRPDRFTLSRDVADSLALRSGTRPGHW